MRIRDILKRLLKGLGVILGTALCGAVLYLAVIMTDTPERQEALQAEPGSSAWSDIALTENMHLSISSLSQASQYFGGKMLVLPDGANFKLAAMEIRDWRPVGAPSTVRELRLRYDGEDGTLWVSSIWPSSYLSSLPSRGYAPVAQQGETLAGLRAVFLTDGAGLVHVHADVDDVAFQIEGDVTMETLRQIAWQARITDG